MMDLPLFPLNTVLFPGMPLSLHIFEDRYKRMINMCISEKMPFGVMLIADGTEALGPLAKPHTIGCTARITQVQPLMQGRMNLVAVGEERFRLHDVDRESQPYLVGKVEMLPFNDKQDNRIKGQGEKLRPDVLRYLEILAQAGDVQFDADQIPDDTLSLAYLAAFLVRIDAQKKQSLLEADSAVKFVSRVRSLYTTETAILEGMLKHSQEEEDNSPFSLN